VRRLLFAFRVARRSPALLLDYVRLWTGARKAPAPGAPAGDVAPISTDDAVALVADGPVTRGPAHAVVVESVAALGGDWASMDADTSLGELAYALVRALRPDVVIETGVARGITSAFVLAALEDNGGAGALHSIDLPPPRMVELELVSTAIPHALRSRWTYHWGSSRRLLRRVLRDAPGARRMFIHDSDHSYANMRWELETAWAALAPGDVLLCDDANFHAGFADAAAALGADAHFVAQPTQGGLTGLLVRTSSRT
jgi:predicted O-methyltransferase YrrM